MGIQIKKPIFQATTVLYFAQSKIKKKIKKKILKKKINKKIKKPKGSDDESRSIDQYI